MSGGPTYYIRGGRPVCPRGASDTPATLHIEHGRIRAWLAPDEPLPAEATIVDASGCWLFPGAIDLSTQLREPGREEEETLETTLLAAKRGGFAAILAMPTTSPVVDGADDVRERSAHARALGGPAVFIAGALTKGANGQELAEMGDMTSAGAVAFTDAPQAVADTELLRRAMEYAHSFDAPVIASGACPQLAQRGVIAEGEIATRLGLAGIPEAAETTFVARHIELCRLTGARVHLGPLSCARSVDMLMRGQDEGLPLTAEVHPTHLLLDETLHRARPYDTTLRLSPPLRTARDRNLLLDAVVQGRLLLASGHAPVGRIRREVEFALAETGISSLATTLPVLLSAMPGNDLTPLAVARALCLGPAQFLRLADRGHLQPGARADIAVIGGATDARVSSELLGADACSSPFFGHPLTHAVRTLLLADEDAGAVPTDSERSFA